MLVRLGLVLGSVGLGACSLLLEWDISEQRCGEDQACLDGYSCLGNTCISDSSVAEHETCVRDQQCAEGLICTPQPRYVCRKPCDDFFVPSANCGADMYCRPSPSPVDGTPRGSCVKSECTEDADCDSALICVAITDYAGACLRPCSYAVSTSGAYSDQCREPDDYCQPLGLSGAQRVVCLQHSEVTQSNYGVPCDYARNTCGVGAACIDGQCRPFCDAETGHPCCAGTICPAYCLTTETETATFAYCTAPTGP